MAAGLSRSHTSCGATRMIDALGARGFFSASSDTRSSSPAPSRKSHKPSAARGYVVRNVCRPSLVPVLLTRPYIPTVDLCSVVADTFEHTTSNLFFPLLYHPPRQQGLPPDISPILPPALYRIMTRRFRTTRTETCSTSRVSSVRSVLP